MMNALSATSAGMDLVPTVVTSSEKGNREGQPRDASSAGRSNWLSVKDVKVFA